MHNDGQILLNDSKMMKRAVKGSRESCVVQLNVDDNDEERIVYSKEHCYLVRLLIKRNRCTTDRPGDFHDK